MKTWSYTRNFKFSYLNKTIFTNIQIYAIAQPQSFSKLDIWLRKFVTVKYLNLCLATYTVTTINDLLPTEIHDTKSWTARSISSFKLTQNFLINPFNDLYEGNLSDEAEQNIEIRCVINFNYYQLLQLIPSANYKILLLQKLSFCRYFAYIKLVMSNNHCICMYTFI